MIMLNIPLTVRYITRVKTIKLCQSVPKPVIAGVCFSQTSVTLARDFAAVRIRGVSVIARCPQDIHLIQWFYR